jgi:hypothetical protein
MSDIENNYIHKDIIFEIIGDHPHTGEICHPIGADKDHIHQIAITPSSEPLFEMSLINCEHGLEGCYVPKHNLRLLRKPLPKMKVEIKSFRSRIR